MNRRERELVERTYRECVNLKKRGELTGFGLGELMLCKRLLKKEMPV